MILIKCNVIRINIKIRKYTHIFILLYFSGGSVCTAQSASLEYCCTVVACHWPTQSDTFIMSVIQAPALILLFIDHKYVFDWLINPLAILQWASKYLSARCIRKWCCQSSFYIPSFRSLVRQKCCLCSRRRHFTKSPSNILKQGLLGFKANTNLRPQHRMETGVWLQLKQNTQHALTLSAILLVDSHMILLWTMYQDSSHQCIAKGVVTFALLPGHGLFLFCIYTIQSIQCHASQSLPSVISLHICELGVLSWLPTKLQ
jgi:hypothetical protein